MSCNLFCDKQKLKDFVNDRNHTILNIEKRFCQTILTVHQPNCVGISKNNYKSGKTIKGNYFGCVKFFMLLPRYDETK